MPMPGPTSICRRHEAVVAASKPPASSRSRVVSTWHPAITVRARTSSPPAVRTDHPSPRRLTDVTASPRVTVPPSASILVARATESAPLPPTARPGGVVCINVLNATIGAVPGSDIGGPDCAPNHARAALSRSLSNQRSSSASPDARNSRESAAGPSFASIPQNEEKKARPVGGAPKERITRALRGPHTATKRRYASASRRPQAASIDAHVASRSTENTMPGSSVPGGGGANAQGSQSR